MSIKYQVSSIKLRTTVAKHNTDCLLHSTAGYASSKEAMK